MVKQFIKLEKLKGNYLYAREDQTLRTHLSNMIGQIPTIFSKFRISVPGIINPRLNYKIDNESFMQYISFIFAFHDFGKSTPAFQQKIKRLMDKSIPKLTSDQIPFSYHTQLGGIAIFCLLSYRKFCKIEDNKLIFDFKSNEQKTINEHVIKLFRDVDPEWYNEVNTDPRTDEEFYSYFFTVIGLLSISLHHNKALGSFYKGFINNSSINRIEKLLTKSLEDLIYYAKQFPLFDEFLSNLYESKHWNFSIINGLKNFLALTSNEEDFIGFMDDYLSDFKKILINHHSSFKGVFHLIFGLIYSALCETDEWDAKSYIEDSSNHRIEFEPNRLKINQNVVNDYRVKKWGINGPKYIPNLPNTSEETLIYLKNYLFSKVDDLLDNIDLKETINKIYLIDAPTGSAKTLAMLHFGYGMRKKFENSRNYSPRIIYALPFISIVEQVGEVITELHKNLNLKEDAENVIDRQNQLLTLHHHLADSEWFSLELDQDDNDGNSIVKGEDTEYAFLNHRINTWHSEIIVTSFVKLFNTILKCSKREFIRFHRLMSTIIIIDEIQGIPAQYWELIQNVFEVLITRFDCTIILGSATSPRSLLPSNNLEVLDIFDIDEKILKKLNRYQVSLDCFSNLDTDTIISQSFQDFQLQILEEIQDSNTNLMIVLNTTRSAFELYQYLTSNTENDNIFLLTTKIMPYHRIEVLEEIKNQLISKKRTVLVCTQLIEAGVDVSFNKVYRDFCPLDSLIQVAGRCNRYSQDLPGTVHLISLKNKNGIRFAKQTYSKLSVNLDVTRELLTSSGKKIITEYELSELGKKYFTKIKDSKLTYSLKKEFREGRFEIMNSSFKLIDENDYIPLIFQTKDNMKVVGNYLKKKIKHIPNKLRKYVVEVSEKDKQRLISRLDAEDKTGYRKIKGKYSESEFYFVQLNRYKNPEKIYTKYSGVIMTDKEE